jgi:hypothetical protein
VFRGINRVEEIIAEASAPRRADCSVSQRRASPLAPQVSLAIAVGMDNDSAR